MDIRPDAWLSRVIGRASFQVLPAEPEAPSAYREAIVPHLLQQEEAFYYTRIDPASLREIQELTSIGFYAVDGGVTLERAPDSPEPSKPELSVREIEPAQHDPVLEIAGTCFRFSRFHADPLLGPGIAHRIKREWVNSYLQGLRGDSLRVAVVDSRPAGFLASMETTRDGRKTRVLDLIGVRPELQGKGVGRALVADLLRRSSAEGVRVVVGTQAGNLPSLRLYSRMGFLITQSRCVMHMHVRKGTAVGLPCT